MNRILLCAEHISCCLSDSTFTTQLYTAPGSSFFSSCFSLGNFLFWNITSLWRWGKAKKKKKKKKNHFRSGGTDAHGEFFLRFTLLQVLPDLNNTLPPPFMICLFFVQFALSRALSLSLSRNTEILCKNFRILSLPLSFWIRKFLYSVPQISDCSCIIVIAFCSLRGWVSKNVREEVDIHQSIDRSGSVTLRITCRQGLVAFFCSFFASAS